MARREEVARDETYNSTALLWKALLPLFVYLLISVALLATSYHFYFIGDDFDGIVPNYAVDLWLAGSLLVWLVATLLMLRALRSRSYRNLWLTPFVWLAASWFVHEVTTSWLPSWSS